VPGAAGRPLALPCRPRPGPPGAQRSGAAAARPGWTNGRQAGRPGHELLRVAPPVYFRALCGVDVPAADGMVKCPLPDHDDAYASCQVFAEAERGWWCFGCARGGRVYDLASLLKGGPWGRELRGDAFSRAVELAREALGGKGIRG
jgi:hypothetical protein